MTGTRSRKKKPIKRKAAKIGRPKGPTTCPPLPWKGDFLRELRATGMPIAACRRVGVSRELAYYYRRTFRDFRAQWDKALKETTKHDWTEAFLVAVRHTGNIKASCELAGVGSATVYYLRAVNATFRNRWMEALAVYYHEATRPPAMAREALS